MKLPLIKNIFLCLWFVALFFLMNSVQAAFDAETGKKLNNLKAIDISTQQNGQIVAKLMLEDMLDSKPIGVALSNPSRIYFDLHNVSNGLGKNYQEIDEGDLHSINIVQVGDRTRLVLNLSRLMHHETLIEDNSLMILLNTVSDKHLRENTVAKFKQDTAEKALNSMLDVDFAVEKVAKAVLLSL